MPTFLIPIFKPKVIGSISKDGQEVGRVVGINTKPFKMLEKDQCIKFVEAIEKVKLKTDTTIYIEDFKSYPLELFELIEDITELNFCTGDNIRTQNIPLLLNEITKKVSKDLHMADTLIICDNKERIIEIIKRLSNIINFFTVIGVESSKKEEVYDYVFESIGISIFQPKNIDKILKNYSTIINTMDEIYFDINNIRNQSVIIDFSCKKPLRPISHSKKNYIYVEDINFKANNLSNWIKEYIDPELSEGLMENETKFSQIYTNNDYYFLEDYVTNKIRIRGRI